VASPATVSRAGMVYLDVDDLGYGPFVDSWLARAFAADEDRTLVRDLFEKWVPRLTEFKRREVRWEARPCGQRAGCVGAGGAAQRYVSV
jgi:dynein heavy chain